MHIVDALQRTETSRTHRLRKANGLAVDGPFAETKEQLGGIYIIDVEDSFRNEFGCIIATLIRVLGDFDVAEEAIQHAFITVFDRWPRDGISDNLGAWITTTARRKAIDRLRREGV